MNLIVDPDIDIGLVFEPFKDPRVDTLAPKLLFTALNLAAMGLGVWKLNTLGLLPTNASDWVSSLSPARMEYRLSIQGAAPLLLLDIPINQPSQKTDLIGRGDTE
ncbi:hypothetical protein TRIUR3_22541 [Triticum urartu]|uniref:ER membrane protein complex subunit 4 n=1 Tax=Triticum urartu TaxID=4572 RepID=M8AK42_TRIUA|nr:hypothetical protein TRIUR3_22541 [Triticum urartu]